MSSLLSSIKQKKRRWKERALQGVGAHDATSDASRDAALARVEALEAGLRHANDSTRRCMLALRHMAEAGVAASAQLATELTLAATSHDTSDAQADPAREASRSLGSHSTGSAAGADAAKRSHSAAAAPATPREAASGAAAYGVGEAATPLGAGLQHSGVAGGGVEDGTTATAAAGDAAARWAHACEGLGGAVLEAAEDLVAQEVTGPIGELLSLLKPVRAKVDEASGALTDADAYRHRCQSLQTRKHYDHDDFATQQAKHRAALARHAALSAEVSLSLQAMEADMRAVLRRQLSVLAAVQAHWFAHAADVTRAALPFVPDTSGSLAELSSQVAHAAVAEARRAERRRQALRRAALLRDSAAAVAAGTGAAPAAVAQAGVAVRAVHASSAPLSVSSPRMDPRRLSLSASGSFRAVHQRAAQAAAAPGEQAAAPGSLSPLGPSRSSQLMPVSAGGEHAAAGPAPVGEAAGAAYRAELQRREATAALGDGRAQASGSGEAAGPTAATQDGVSAVDREAAGRGGGRGGSGGSEGESDGSDVPPPPPKPARDA